MKKIGIDLAYLLFLFLFLPAGPIQAQEREKKNEEEPDAQKKMEVVYITAQKREQALQEVGIAVTTFTGEQMKSFGIEESIDVVHMTPGVHLGGATGGQLMVFTVRGVTQNDFSPTTEAPTAVFVDEGYISNNMGQRFALFDIERNGFQFGVFC